MSRRWLVVFHSHPVPPSDATVVDVRATSQLRAIHEARRTHPPQHPWSYVSAVPWPRGCAGVDEAVARLSAASSR